MTTLTTQQLNQLQNFVNAGTCVKPSLPKSDAK
jgi:hypothetical protein